ncbi:MAG: minichromosome maintenance protein MCM [Nanoarchaeota archaeon]
MEDDVMEMETAKPALNAAEQIQKFQEFFESRMMTELLEQVRKGHTFIVIDFNEISKHDIGLAEEILEYPDEVIKAAELAVLQFDLPAELKHFHVRFRNLSQNAQVMIRDIRSKHINKFISIQGVVRQKSEVRPQVTTVRFECPSCGNVITILQLDSSWKEPSRCSCGRKGKFKQLSKELVDAQGLVVEESPEDLTGGEQPKRMNIFLKDDLVSPLSEKRTNPGTKIRIAGVVKEVPIFTRMGTKSTRFDLLVEANGVEAIAEDFYEILITPEEETQIKEIAADPKVMQRLVNSCAPSIYGHDRVKEALLLQLAGGVHKTRSDGMTTRGDMHVLLVGDPGAGKSQLLKRVNQIAPKSRYVSGKGASGAGLTASVVKDEFLKGWSLEAGALVLANNGVCCIDEFDKMDVEDRAAMHEALEQQTVSISKANIQATLIARTTVLAAANPKLGRFDPYDLLANQIDLPSTLINRFDLIFPIKDLPDKDTDTKMAAHILSLHQNPMFEEPEISTNLLKKYISYARQRISPVLTDSAIEEIKDYYLKMRDKSSTEEGGIKAVPISPRQLEALVRLAEASAKLRMSDKVTKRDAKRAIDLLHYCLQQIGIDPETGKIDIDRIATGVPATERSKIVSIREIIQDLENQLGKTIPIDDVIKLAAERGITEEKVEEAIEKLKRSGDIFEPRHGFISRI